MFLLGHSMGGLIVAVWSMTRRLPLAGVIISASTVRLNAALFPALRRSGGPGRPLAAVAAGRAGRLPVHVAGPGGGGGVQADPLVFHGRFPVRTGAELLRAMRWWKAARTGCCRRSCCCTARPTGCWRPEGSRDFYHRTGSPDKTLRLYDGLYHDIFHEPEHPRVLAELWAGSMRGASASFLTNA